METRTGMATMEVTTIMGIADTTIMAEDTEDITITMVCVKFPLSNVGLMISDSDLPI